jgi:hypothetical protein
MQSYKLGFFGELLINLRADELELTCWALSSLRLNIHLYKEGMMARCSRTGQDDPRHEA